LTPVRKGFRQLDDARSFEFEAAAFQPRLEGAASAGQVDHLGVDGLNVLPVNRGCTAHRGTQFRIRGASPDRVARCENGSDVAKGKPDREHIREHGHDSR